MRRTVAIGLAVLAARAADVNAQMGELGDSVYRRLLAFSTLVKGGSITPNWMADRRSFWYVEGAPARTRFLRIDPTTGAATPLFDIPRLRTALASQLGHNPPYEGAPFETFSFVDQERAITFALEGSMFRWEIASGQLRRLGPATTAAPVAGPVPGAPVTALPSPNGQWTAIVERHNLALKATADGRTVPLTTDGVDRYGWALYPVSWAPNGTSLLAGKSDQRAIHFIPVVHWLKANREEITYQPYPGTGEATPLAELHLVDAISGRRVTVEGTAPDHDIFPLGWRRGGSEVLFLRSHRLRKSVELLAAAVATGKAAVLVRDSQATFVEGLALNPANLYTSVGDGERFVWRSERTGWSNLYLYDAAGTLIRPLTSGNAPVENVVAIDERGGWVYYLAHGDPARPYDEHVFRVDLEGKRSTRLTPGTGVHAAVFSPDRSVFLATHSTVARPPEVELRRNDGSLVRSLAQADITGLTSLGWRAPEPFTVKAADGTTDLWGVLYLPHNFDRARRYPVVDLQYMGNFIHSAPHRFAGTWLGDDAQSLTQLGFVVFIVDARGTPGRGKAFQDFTYRNVGVIEVPDHAATLRQLARTRPYMDTTRVGITGYSWGGYFTIRAMLTEPDLFKVGVAGAPVVDFIAATSPIEPYMGLPQDNPTGYQQGSNPRLAANLKGKLLIHIGTSDVNVTFNHTMRMADALIKAGKFFDLLVMPGETHGLTPTAMAYYNEARNRYLVEHLKP